MAKRQYDVAVIGSGPGGYVAAIRAAQLGLKTACIEKGATYGGTCLNVGCIPSKALLQSTETYDLLAHHAADHGITAEKVSFDFDAMQRRKEVVVDSLVSGVAGLFKRNGVEGVKGTARFVDPFKVEVDDGKSKSTLEADNFIIATGSEATPLPFLPFDEQRVVSSTGVLALKSVPKRLLVVGAGVIGVELASVYRRLGTDVVIVEMLDRICPMMDAAVSKGLLQILKKQGLTFHLSAKVASGTQSKDGVSLAVVVDGREERFDADVALIAIGRRPNAANLGLQEIGISRDARGFIPVDGMLRTAQAHIYAIGDVVDGAMLAHRASEEGVVAAEIIAGHRPRIDYLAIPNVIYTSPEVAAVGLTEGEAKDAGLEVFTGTCQFKGNARARCHANTEGFVKVIGDKASGRLIGMHIIGLNASEMIGEGVIALSAKQTVEEVANASHAHPTLTEAIKEACLAALSRPIHI